MKLKKSLSPIRKNAVLCILSIIFIAISFSFARSFVKTGAFKDRLWLHRTLSMEKMEEKAYSYPNVETDVVWRNGFYDVTHDIDVSYGLRLDSILAEVSRRGSQIWLDFKNLSEKNSDAALRELDRLSEGIPHGHIIVESPEWRQLKKFRDSGYLTSCYVLPRRKHLDSRSQKLLLDSIAEIIVPSGCVTSISFDKEWYFPISNRLKGYDIDLLTWSHHTDEWLFWILPESYFLENNPQLKVILVKSKAKNSVNR